MQNTRNTAKLCESSSTGLGIIGF